MIGADRYARIIPVAGSSLGKRKHLGGINHWSTARNGELRIRRIVIERSNEVYPHRLWRHKLVQKAVKTMLNRENSMWSFGTASISMP